MPDTELKPDEKTGPIARDPLLGLEVPVYLGGDTLVVEEPAGDRGDDVASKSPSSEPPSTEPKAPETEPKGDKAPDDEPEELTDEQKAALPQRGPDGKFIKSKDEGTQGEEPRGEDTAPRIPKVRLDKEIEKRKQLEARIKELEGKEQAVERGAAQTYDFDAAEEEYMNLLLDGKLAEAKAKRGEIRAAEKAEFQAVAREASVATTSEVSLRTAMLGVADEMEKAFPGFSAESADYDEAATAQAKAIYHGYIESGLYESPVDAFRAALLTTAAANHWEPVGGKAPKPKVQERTAAGRVAAIAGQPPLAAVAGQSSASAGAAALPDLATLTDEQIAKLPVATLKRLRGDEL